MDEAEHSRYVAQLRAEFDRCDTTATGFLDRDELTELFRRLQLDAHLELLLDALLGERPYGRVNFEEFKDGFVDVLSRSLDISTSEEDSSYLEPALPQEVQPKLVKGTKRYGRRSRPEPRPGSGLTANSGESTPSGSNAADSSPPAVRRAKLRRSTSLESLESLKSDEEAGSSRIDQKPFQNKADQQEDGGAGPGVQTAVCDPLALQDVDVLLRRLDGHLDGQAGVQRFRQGLWSSAPTLSSTPLRSAKNQQLVPEEGPARSASPSLLTATVGPRVLSRLDDGSGSTSPERVAALWTEEGIRNSWEILQTLDFSLEDRLSLADLTLALDNELLVSGNGIHQAALISYRSEIQHLQEVAEQACRERDKLRADLELADHRNLQLVREVDDRHASMETLNESRIRDLEQDFRERLTALRCQAEQESEALLQQGEQECSALQEELQLLRAQEAELQEELGSAAQEKQRVEEELEATKMKLRDAEGSVQRLQKEVDQLLNQKFGSLDPSGAALSHEERFSEILRDYELQCRELQDRNDELSSELELLRSRKGIQPAGGAGSSLSWSQQYQDSGDAEMTSSSSSAVRKKLQPEDKSALSSLDVSGPSVSIQTELALQQLKENHQKEIQQLQIQLETQGNYYERQLDMMKQNMEVERKDISQAFKLEISELEEQKVQLEQQVKQLKETVARLQVQVQQGGGRSGEVERRMQRERAELEQNYATEISNLVQKLSGEKEQLEAELKLRMDQELMRVRTQLEEVRSENAALQERLKVLQQEVQNLEDEAEKKRRRLQEVELDRERSREEEERLHRENSSYREEVLDLSSRNLQLSSENGELSSRLHGEQESVRMLQERLATVTKKQEEEGAAVQQLQEEKVKLQEEKVKLQEELISFREKLGSQSQQEAELRRLMMKLQKVEQEKLELQRETENRNQQVEQLQQQVEQLQQQVEQLQQQVEQLQQQVVSLQAEAELLRSQLLASTQDKLGHAQEVTQLHRKLREALSKVEETQADVRRLMEEKEELQQNLQDETWRLLVQNQELRQQVQEVQQQQKLRFRLEAATARAHAQDQEKERQLEEEVKLRRTQLSMKQEQFDKATAALQRRADQLEVQLKALRLVLQDKVQELKEQVEKNVQSSGLLKDLYLENAQLMKALQVTERRQKQAEKKNRTLEDKVGALNQLLKEVVATVLST